MLKPKIAVVSVAEPPVPLVEAVCKPIVDQAVCEALVPVKHHQPPKKIKVNGAIIPAKSSSFLHNNQYKK